MVCRYGVWEVVCGVRCGVREVWDGVQVWRVGGGVRCGVREVWDGVQVWRVGGGVRCGVREVWDGVQVWRVGGGVQCGVREVGGDDRGGQHQLPCLPRATASPLVVIITISMPGSIPSSNRRTPGRSTLAP